jgi:hypothetical protein
VTARLRDLHRSARLDFDAIHAYLTRSYWSPAFRWPRVERRTAFVVLRRLREARARRWDSRASSPTTRPSPIYATSTCSRSTAATVSASE